MSSIYIQQPSLRKRKESRPMFHIDNGFPHYSSINESRHCMCLDNCCYSEDTGCICKTCPCQRGINHAPTIQADERLAALAAQRAKRNNSRKRKTATQTATGNGSGK